MNAKYTLPSMLGSMKPNEGSKGKLPDSKRPCGKLKRNLPISSAKKFDLIVKRVKEKNMLLMVASSLTMQRDRPIF